MGAGGRKEPGRAPSARAATLRLERLPALPAGARVVLTEGEKAADALTGRGIAAVASVTGASSTPGDDTLRPLVRLSVVLWPDNDGVGREHMQLTGDALRRLGCADVRLVRWPDAPDKGDAADFHGTDAELTALLDGAQPCETTPTPDGAGVLGDVRAFLRRYVATGDVEADTLTLWTAHTYASGAAEATAYLNLTSAEKRSGKTRTLEALALLTASPWLTSRTSSAVLVRKLDRDGPTLLLDETDAAFKDGGDYAEALRAVLNAGHRRGGVASLCVKAGGDFELRDFAVFGPKAFAGIGQHLPETVRIGVSPLSYGDALQRKPSSASAGARPTLRRLRFARRSHAGRRRTWTLYGRPGPIFPTHWTIGRLTAGNHC